MNIFEPNFEEMLSRKISMYWKNASENGSFKTYFIYLVSKQKI